MRLRSIRQPRHAHSAWIPELITKRCPTNFGMPIRVVLNTAMLILVGCGNRLGGGEIPAAILADDTYIAVHGVGRRALAITHPKLTFHVLDFVALPALPAVDDVF